MLAGSSLVRRSIAEVGAGNALCSVRLHTNTTLLLIIEKDERSEKKLFSQGAAGR